MKQILALLVTFACLGCSSATKKPIPGSPPESSPSNVPAASATTGKAETTAAEAAGDKVTCAKDTDSRVLEVVKKDGGCALSYTKLGNSADIATANHGLSYCQEVQKKVREKLEGSGYKCGR